MARFFQAQPAEFVNDFMFEPNMELAYMALAKKDADIADQLDTLELFRNLPIDFWKDADQENVAAIKDEYETRVNDTTKQMQKDLMNTGNNRYLINQLRRDIEKDYETGRIRQIQDNAQAYRDFKTKLDVLPNPVDREAYMKAVDSYLLNNDKGALSSLFKGPELYETRQYGNEFVASDNFKQLEADVKGTIFQSPEGVWLVKRGETVEELPVEKILKAFKGFVMSDPNIMGRAKAGSIYFGENNWLDESGNLRFDEESYLGNQMKFIAPSLSYKKETETKEMDVNPVWAIKERERQQIAAENRAAAAARRTEGAFPISPNKNISFFINYTKEGRQLEADYKVSRNNIIESFMTPEQKALKNSNYKAYTQLLKKTEENLKNNAPNAYAIIADLDNQFQMLQVAGYNDYTKRYNLSQTQLDKIQTIFNSDLFSHAMNTELGYVDFGFNSGKQYTSVEATSGSKVRMQDLVGKRYNIPGPYQNYIIKDYSSIPKSGIPMGYKNTGGEIYTDGATMGYNLTLRNPNSPEGEEEKEEVLVPVDFYVPTYTVDIN